MGNPFRVGSRAVTRLIAAATVIVCLIPRVATALPPGSTPREIELGEEASKDIAKSAQFIHDPQMLAKLQGILDEIAKVTPRPEIEYRPTSSPAR